MYIHKFIICVFAGILQSLISSIYGPLLICSIPRDQGTFYNFVNAIRADGGGDSAEDIIGGLQAAFSRLSWGDEEVVKVI